MRIALLSDNLVFGGINRYCLDLVEGLRAYPDVNISLFALHDRNPPWLLEAAAAHGIPVEVLPMDYVFDSRVIRRLQRLLIERKVDILHSQGYRSSVISRLAVRFGGLPTRLVCTVHGIYQFSSAPMRSKAYYALDYLTLSTCDHIIPVSAATGRHIAAYCRGKPMTVIHNGARVPALPTLAAKLAGRHSLHISDQTQVVSFIGRLSPEKGIASLLDLAHIILSHTHHIIFLVVGDGELRSSIEQLAQEYEGRVLLAGAQRDVSVFYQVSDVVLIPSPMEGLPMVLLEALAHGVPVVANKVGGIPEVLTDGYNGFLVDPHDTEEMHRRILQILSDKALQQELAHHARATVENKFSLAHMAEKTHRVYLAVGMPEGER